MSIVAAQTSDGQFKLMQAIGAVIMQHTRDTPLAIDEIVAVLGFCAGSAIVSGCKANSNRRKMRDVAVANIEIGMDVMTRAATGSSLILPETMN